MVYWGKTLKLARFIDIMFGFYSVLIKCSGVILNSNVQQHEQNTNLSSFFQSYGTINNCYSSKLGIKPRYTTVTSKNVCIKADIFHLFCWFIAFNFASVYRLSHFAFVLSLDLFSFYLFTVDLEASLGETTTSYINKTMLFTSTHEHWYQRNTKTMYE